MTFDHLSTVLDPTLWIMSSYLFVRVLIERHVLKKGNGNHLSRGGHLTCEKINASL